MKRGAEKITQKEGSRNVFLLGGSSFLNDVGSEAITPLIPFYTSALGGGGVAIGLVSGAREGFASLFNLIGGWLSDKTGKRRIFVFLGYLLSAIFKFMISIANSWQLLVSFVSLERFGKARDAPRDAIITKSTKKRGRGFGIQEMMDRAGAIFGTVLVIFLFWKFQFRINKIIMIAAIIAALSLIPLFFIKDGDSKPARKNFIKGIRNLDPKLKYFIFVSSVFTLANFGLYLFLLLKAQQITGGILVPLIIYAAYNLIYSVFSVPFGNLSDRIGRKKVLLTGYFLFFFVCISLIFANNIIYLAILFALYGLVNAMTQSNQRAFVSDISGKMKATAFGVFYSCTGIMNLAGGLFAGILWNISSTLMFSFIAAISFIALILLFFARKR